MWYLMSISLLVSVVLQFYKTGFNVATIVIIIPTFVSLVKILYENSRKIRILFRKAKNGLNLSTFDIDFTAVFDIVENSSISNVDKDYLVIQTILYDLLKDKGYKGSKNELVEVSFDRVSGVKMYVRPHKIYFSFINTDNFGQKNLTIKSSAVLKYRNGEEIIRNFLIAFYRQLNDKLLLKENKYSMKISKNTKTGNFMSKHFIKELPPQEIDNFNIKVKKSNGVHITVNQKEIILVTHEKANLIDSVKYCVELIN